jgi:hypothetical protein
VYASASDCCNGGACCDGCPCCHHQKA